MSRSGRFNGFSGVATSVGCGMGRLSCVRSMTIIMLILVLCCVAWPPRASAGLPLLAQNLQTKLFEPASGTESLPLTIDILRASRGVYLANTNAASDAIYLADQDSLPVTHYLGFTNLYFEGFGNYIAPDGIEAIPESAFYHMTDPATLNAWRTATGIELRWTEDLRFAKELDFYQGVETPSVNISGYIVTRTQVSPPMVTQIFVGAPADSILDNTADPLYAYDYSIQSITSTGDTLSFGAEPVRVEVGESTDPHFWVSKRMYQEDIYYDRRSLTQDVHIAWPIHFHVDRMIDPQYLTIEVYRTSGTDEDTLATYDSGDITYDAVANEIELEIDVQLKILLRYGGAHYRLHYTGGGADIYYPETRGTWRELIGTTVNNRLLGCTWYEYLMNVESQAWQETLVSATEAVLNGVTPPGTGTLVSYPNVFYDSVLALLYRVHNRMRPYEYGGDEAFRDAALELFSEFESRPDFGGLSYWANEKDMRMVAELDSLSAVNGRMQGFMRENLVREDNGTQELAKAIWLFQSRPAAWRNIVQNSFDYGFNVFERDQALASYLLLREGHQDGSTADDVFGFGGWKPDTSRVAPPPDVNILPEQMIRVGDEVADLFGAVSWPTWNEMKVNASSKQLAVNWMSTFVAPDGTGLVRSGGGMSTSIAVRAFEYYDGLPAVYNEVIATWDIDLLPGPHALMLRDLFPDKAGSDLLYELVYDGEYSSLEPARLAEGGAFSTVPVPMDSFLQYSVEEAKIFFTAPVRSPYVDDAAMYTISGDPCYLSTLAVGAHHWNGQPLSIVADCSDLNGDAAVTLIAQGDSTYVRQIAGVTAQDSTFAIPYRAVGTDGLVRYGTIDVTVDSGHTQEFVDFSTETGDLATAVTSMPLAFVPINGDGGVVLDFLLTEGGGPGIYFNASDYGTFVPYFEDVTDTRFGVAPDDRVPAGTASLAVADFDGDGHEDFFACNNAGSRLYRFDPDSSGIYTNVTATFIPDLPDTTFAAAWCDYDRDGWVDLAVAGVNDGVDGIQIFRNELKVMRLVQSIPLPLGGAVRDPSAPYPLAWADLAADDGGRLELIAGATIDGESTLRVFARGSDFDKSLLRYNMVDATSSVFPDSAPHHVAGMSLADLDGDGDQDLVVARGGVGATAKLLVYRNEEGQYVDVTAQAGVDIGDDLAGVVVADMDPGGKPDLVAIPATNESPVLLLNMSASAISFAAQVDSLPAGAASGGLAYDWLGAKPNLYLAKAPTDGQVHDFYYGYVPGEGVSLGKTVRVRVGETDVMNTSGIGTRVEVEWDGKHAFQWFDGGSGRSGQQARELVFALGHVEGYSVIVRATWPDGVVTTHPRLHGGNDLLDFTIERTAQPIIDEASVTASFYLSAGFDNWYVFEWDANRRSNPEVHFEFTDPRTACNCGVETPTVELAWGVPDVAVECVQTDDTVYHHTLVWLNRCCEVTSCVFEYKVRTLVNGVMAESGTHTFRTPKYCPSN